MDFGETQPSGSESERETEGWSQRGRESEKKALKPFEKIVEKQENEDGTGDGGWEERQGSKGKRWMEKASSE